MLMSKSFIGTVENLYKKISVKIWCIELVMIINLCFETVYLSSG